MMFGYAVMFLQATRDIMIANWYKLSCYTPFIAGIPFLTATYVLHHNDLAGESSTPLPCGPRAHSQAINAWTELTKYEIRGHALSMFESYMTYSKQSVDLNRHLFNVKPTLSGVLRRYMGPLLFNIFMNDVVTSTTAKFIIYVDDTSFLFFC